MSGCAVYKDSKEWRSKTAPLVRGPLTYRILKLLVRIFRAGIPSSERRHYSGAMLRGLVFAAGSDDPVSWGIATCIYATDPRSVEGMEQFRWPSKYKVILTYLLTYSMEQSPS